MARAKNKVIAGDYSGMDVSGMFGSVSILTGGPSGNVSVNKDTVEAYELVTDEHRKSAASGAARGLVGGVLLGPVGALAGGLSATSTGIYVVAVQFKDGKKSLLEVNDKIYKMIVTNCFAYSDSSSAGEATSGSSAGGAKVSKEDYAIGNNSVDAPVSGCVPQFEVNRNNQLISIQAVSIIDSFLDGSLDGDSMKEKLDELRLNISNEDTDENREAYIMGGSIQMASSAVASINLALSFNKPVKVGFLFEALWGRNNLARTYIIDEKINVKLISTKIFNAACDVMDKKIDGDELFRLYMVYQDTLRAYLRRAPEDNPVFNDEDIKRINDLAKKFHDGLDSDNPISEEELQAIVDEMEGIVATLPDAPAVDVYYRVKEKPEPPLEEKEEENTQKSVQSSSEGTVSTADEIRKYKELLDDGIITQEEFDAKKKQLMGL